MGLTESALGVFEFLCSRRDARPDPKSHTDRVFAMNEFAFVFAFIWLISAVVSMVLGPLFGLNRKQLKLELIQFWRARSINLIRQSLRRFGIAFAYAGFLCPVIYPIPSLAFALLALLFT